MNVAFLYMVRQEIMEFCRNFYKYPFLKLIDVKGIQGSRGEQGSASSESVSVYGDSCNFAVLFKYVSDSFLLFLTTTFLPMFQMLYTLGPLIISLLA